MQFREKCPSISIIVSYIINNIDHFLGTEKDIIILHETNSSQNNKLICHADYHYTI